MKARGGELQDAAAAAAAGGGSPLTPRGEIFEAFRDCSEELAAGPPLGEDGGGAIKLNTTLEPAISANTPFPDVNMADPTHVSGSV